MARQQTFKQADVTRAVKGVLAGGAKMARMKIDRDGNLTIFFGAGEPAEVDETPLQKWKRENGQG